MLERMIKDSTLTRLLANLFLFVMVVGASGVVGWELVMGQAPNVWLVGILSTAIGSSIKILGISAGMSFAHDTEDNKP